MDSKNKLTLSLEKADKTQLKKSADQKIDAQKKALKKSGYKKRSFEETSKETQSAPHHNSHRANKHRPSGKPTGKPTGNGSRPFGQKNTQKPAKTHHVARPKKDTPYAPPAGRKVRANARAIAHAVLMDVIHGKKLLDESMSTYPQLDKLTARDRNFSHLLVMTILRHARRLDKVIISRLKDPQSLPKELLMVLRIGTAQMLLLNTPAHAAVSTSLELLDKDLRLGRLKGVVNAVLRAIDRQRPEFPFSAPGFPKWLREQLTEDWGAESADEIEQASLAEALLDLTIPEAAFEWAVKLHGTVLPTGSVRIVGNSDLTQLEGYEQGAWWVQDAAAALPAQLLLQRLTSPTTVWDFCAAPGGKTAQLAVAGHNVVALDKSERRLTRLHENMERLNLQDKVQVLVQDALTLAPEAPLDAILLDAPCSATGTIRRHPDLLWQNRDNHLDDLVSIQREMIEKSASLLASGGYLLYCTCSLLRAEGEAQIEKILAKDPSLELVPFTEQDLPGLDVALTPEGMMRIHPFYWPEAGGLDGFFAALLRKK